MSIFEKAKWIWHTNEDTPDDYGEFYSTLDYAVGDAELFIAADSNYAVYINGSLCACGQYADFPHDKVYDKINITDSLTKGKNHIAILVWYYGIGTTLVYYKGKAGLCYEIKLDGKAEVYSSEKTLSRRSRAYECGRKKSITSQLGLSFHYDASCEDDWKSGELDGFSESFLADISAPLRERPIKRLDFSNFKEAKLLKTLENGHILFDLGINTVGFWEIELEADRKTHVTLSYGEHIMDGYVRQIIDNRDFSVELTVGDGNTEYLNPFRRLGARYLEIWTDFPVKIKKIGLRETVYPLTSLPRPTLTEKENEIYDICERSLKLCMHEHYEDCPWREQALYCMDSRNQMLCGYYAFGEFEFPRACLKLIASDNRPDGLLNICAPSSSILAIPSFSLHYFIECAEYLLYSKDKQFISEIYPKLVSIIEVFLKKMEENGGLVPPFKEKGCWNFYEWSQGLSSSLHNEPPSYPDVLLNSLLSIALQKMAYMTKEIGLSDIYTQKADALNKNIKAKFYDKEAGLFKNWDMVAEYNYSVLGNSLAILAGIVSDEEAAQIAQKMCEDKSLTPISLSMRCFFNDALLKVDREKYTNFIFECIEHEYRPMVEAGIGTVWEHGISENTTKASSLCHGWSALPIYYYHLLRK